MGIAEFFGSVGRIKEFQKLNKEEAISEESSEDRRDRNYESPKSSRESETWKVLCVSFCESLRHILEM